MADTKYNSKIIFYGETLMDLTGDTVDAASLLKGKTAHDKTGAPITGTCPYDADTSDATATAAEILNGKTAYVDGAKVTGTMPNKGAVTLSIVDKSPVAIPAGYHDGPALLSSTAPKPQKLLPVTLNPVCPSQTVSLSSSWIGSGPYYQTILTGQAAGLQVNLNPTIDQLAALADAGVTSMVAANENGTVKIYAAGAAPAAMSLQITKIMTY